MRSREFADGEVNISRHVLHRQFHQPIHDVRFPNESAEYRVARDQLLEAVWKGEPESDNVVAVYVGYLRQKLEEGGEPRLLHTVRGAGYALKEN